MKSRTTILIATLGSLGLVSASVLTSRAAYAGGGKTLRTQEKGESQEDGEKSEKGGQETSGRFVMPHNPGGKVTPWQAMATAEKATGGHAVQALFEYEGGKWIYGVVVLKGHKLLEVELSSDTGKVGDTEEITPTEEGKETAAELTRVVASGK